MNKVTAFSINNKPTSQPTPVLVFGEIVKFEDIKIGDQLYLVDRPGVIVDISNIVRDEDPNHAIGLYNSQPIKIGKYTRVFKKIQDIPENQQEFFLHDQDITGKFSDGGIFIPDEKYLINYTDLFTKYFDLIRRQFWGFGQDDRIQSELCSFWHSAIKEMGVGVFNEYIRSNFTGRPNNDETFHGAYEYGFEFFHSSDRFVRIAFNHLFRMDRGDLFINGVKSIVYGEAVKIDFSKLS